MAIVTNAAGVRLYLCECANANCNHSSMFSNRPAVPASRPATASEWKVIREMPTFPECRRPNDTSLYDAQTNEVRLCFHCAFRAIEEGHLKPYIPFWENWTHADWD